MSEWLVGVEALVRTGKRDLAIGELEERLPSLTGDERRKALRVLGVAQFFSRRYPAAAGAFEDAAEGSDVPEDWFNVAQARLKAADVEGAHEAWERCAALSREFPDAPETSTLADKKLRFAQLLREAGAYDERGLRLLQRELLDVFREHHTTHLAFSRAQGLPPFDDVLRLTGEYFRATGRTKDEWEGFLDELAPSLDESGQTLCGRMKRAW